MDEEQATLDGQFIEFSKFMDKERDGTTITLWRSDFWMRQSKILEDRKLTMTETGILWFKYWKTELTFDEWHEYLTDLCQTKKLDQEAIELVMTNCGIPGVSPVNIPQFRDFFDTFKPRSKMMF
ncbi:tubulin polymerization-promoting protein homolog [Anticarsia gemmatalis]|uniref:tubulin polymerization-promoting protein homolog n=1 Tax=Anticarsia gemmatalis TaxID=129554 RepID=UPI003F769936